jgi:hypothetical protein
MVCRAGLAILRRPRWPVLKAQAQLMYVQGRNRKRLPCRTIRRLLYSNDSHHQDSTHSVKVPDPTGARRDVEERSCSADKGAALTNVTSTALDSDRERSEGVR